MLTKQVFLNYDRTERPTPLKQKQWQNVGGGGEHSRIWGVRKHFQNIVGEEFPEYRKILYSVSTFPLKYKNLKHQNNHEGDPSKLKKVRSQMVLLKLCVSCIFDPD